MIYRLFILLLVPILATSCIKTQSSSGQNETPITVPEVSPAAIKKPNQILSLLGKPLPEKSLTPKTKEERTELLEEARSAYESDPENIEKIIWYGRRLAYLGLYEDAINIYSVGLNLKPNSYKLLRHRGHRYITTRQFDKAIEDLQSAVFYSRTDKNEVEPDGLPNRLNTPLSNNKFNIWYHLGIAYYLKGNYDKALSCFKKCNDFADNDDLLVATSDWTYLTYQKIGNKSAADEILTPIQKRMHVIEYTAYLQRLLTFKGEILVEDLLDEAERADDSLDPTLGYGIAQYYLFQGNIVEAKKVINRVLLNDQWDAFGYIAAEADKISLENL